MAISRPILFRAARRVSAALLVLALGGCDDPLPVAGDPCERLEDCTAGAQLVCAPSGVCSRVRCDASAQCPANTFCVDGLCDLAECAGDSECDGAICYEGDCRADLCTSNDDCRIDQICRGVPPICQAPPAVCFDDADCPANGACLLPAGICSTRCEFSTDCPTERYCDARGACRSACEAPSECPEEEVCFAGECVPACLDSSASCAPELPFRLPDSCACAECLVDVDCVRDGEGCLGSGRCTYCPRRADSREGCEASGLIYRDGCCSECIDDVDCSSGLACERGRCVAEDPRECTDDGDCEGDLYCDNGRCELGGSLTPCAAQSECPEGEACYPEGRCRTESTGCVECVEGSRCVSGAGDGGGYCAGCADACGTVGCESGSRCVIPDGAPEGFCVEAIFSGCP